MTAKHHEAKVHAALQLIIDFLHDGCGEKPACVTEASMVVCEQFRLSDPFKLQAEHAAKKRAEIVRIVADRGPLKDKVRKGASYRTVNGLTVYFLEPFEDADQGYGWFGQLASVMGPGPQTWWNEQGVPYVDEPGWVLVEKIHD